ncbi:MAG: hypothetical protein K0S20_404, partial [Patescibacteria group bacterium]|nr:hypothetical protein [Patescibacteria group bacterium]
EEIAQHKTDMHGLLSGDVARNLYGKIGESLQERLLNGGAMGLGSVMAAAALFKKTKAELSQKPGEVSTKMEQPVIGFEGLVTEEEPVSSDSDPAPSAEPSFSEEPVLEVESSSSPEEVRVEGGEEPAAIPEVEESHIDSSAAVPPASSAPTPEGFIPETSGIETGPDTGDSVSIPDDSPKSSPSRPGGDSEVGPHGELLLTPLESLQRDPFPSTATEWNEELGGRTKRMAVSINKPEVKDWLLSEAATMEGVKKILLLPPATPFGDVQDAYEAFAASLRKTGRHYKDNKSSLEEVLGKIKATIKGSIPKISDPDPEPEPSGPAGGSAAKEMELPETDLFPRRSSAREVHRAAGVGKPPMPVGSKVEPVPAEAGTAAESIPAAAEPIKDDSESVSAEAVASAAESEVSSDPESEATPSKEKNLEEESVHELWEDRVETDETTRYGLITRRTEYLFENLLTEEGSVRANRYLSRDGLRKLLALPKDVPAETLKRGLDSILITLETHPEYLNSDEALAYMGELKHIVEAAEREEREEDERIEAEERALTERGEGKARRKDSRSRRKDYDGHAEKWR